MPTRLDESYRAAVLATRRRVEQFARTRFAAGQFRDADLDRFVKAVVPVVLAGQRQVSALTDAYLAQRLTVALGRTVRPSGPLNDYPRGVDPSEVYARPYVTVRTKLSDGLALDAAVSAGLARLEDIARTDMQLAKTWTARASFRSSGIQSYARVLVGGKNCALCYVASTQRYSRDDLMPIHPGCNCDVEPVTDHAAFDEQSAANLEATHEAVQDRLGESDRGARAPDYRKALIVREHGEMGPVLAVRGQHFAGRSVMDN